MCPCVILYITPPDQELGRVEHKSGLSLCTTRLPICVVNLSFQVLVSSSTCPPPQKKKKKNLCIVGYSLYFYIKCSHWNWILFQHLIQLVFAVSSSGHRVLLPKLSLKHWGAGHTFTLKLKENWRKIEAKLSLKYEQIFRVWSNWMSLEENDF